MVCPACRIPVAKIDSESSSFGWAAGTEKLLQPIDKESPLGVEGKDPAPQISEIDSKEATAENLPTLWLGKPQATASGFIRLVDGQTLSLGKHREIKTVSGERLQLMEAGNANAKLSIPIEQVAANVFPK